MIRAIDGILAAKIALSIGGAYVKGMPCRSERLCCSDRGEGCHVRSENPGRFLSVEEARELQTLSARVQATIASGHLELAEQILKLTEVVRAIFEAVSVGADNKEQLAYIAGIRDRVTDIHARISSAGKDLNDYQAQRGML